MIDEILNNLGTEERNRLMIAFEEEFTQVINLNDSKILGVNVVDKSKYIVLEEQGVWLYAQKI